MIREVLDLRRLHPLSPDEAAALLAARRLEAPSLQDDGALAAWLALDPANRPAWESAQRALTAFDGAGDDELLAAMRQAARAAGPAPRSWVRPAAAAAAILVLALGGVLAISIRQDGAGTDPMSGRAVAQAPSALSPGYQTRLGERTTFILPDGSRMTLDTDSAAEIAFAADKRALHLLRGRAFFDVKPDSARPFAVRAGAREVVALGTRFDIRLDPGRLRVVLVEGRVSITPANGGSPQILRAGEQLVERAGATATISPADVDEALNWQQGFVTFRDDTVSAAAAELNRYGPDRLVVRDPGVAALRITGVFRAGDPARFGRTLTQIHPVRIVRRSADELEIVPAS